MKFLLIPDRGDGVESEVDYADFETAKVTAHLMARFVMSTACYEGRAEIMALCAAEPTQVEIVIVDKDRTAIFQGMVFKDAPRTATASA